MVVNLANALADSGQNDEAVATAQRAMALQPGNAAAYDVLGRALVGQGRLADAANAFARALAIAPGDREAIEALGRLQPSLPLATVH